MADKAPTDLEKFVGSIEDVSDFAGAISDLTSGIAFLTGSIGGLD